MLTCGGTCMCERNVMLCSKPGQQMIDVFFFYPSMPLPLTEKIPLSFIH